MYILSLFLSEKLQNAVLTSCFVQFGILVSLKASFGVVWLEARISPSCVELTSAVLVKHVEWRL